MTLTTPWGETLDPEHPLPEHPRPQLVRDGWRVLNGRWDYAITPFAAADPEAVADPCGPPSDWDGRIVVPFSPETALSGVGRALEPDQTLWYRRTFEAAPGPEERVLLHFGAVDQSCRVAVDGVEVGRHTGGYLPFTLDVTDALSGTGTHELVVAVRDVSDTSWLSRGKQRTARGGIWYTPQSGIWQTVWLEVVPRAAVDRLVLVPDLDAGAVVVTVVSTHGEGTARVEVLDGAAPVAAADVPVGVPTPVPLAGTVRTWSPQDPFLYGVRVRLGDDEAASYVGMRSFGVGTTADGRACLLLNGEPHLPVGLLDQGYWPDGGYTAPSDEALAYDVEVAKRMGFTMLRKHIKVEPLRWYHHCDRLGLLVWQDHVNGGREYNPAVISAPALVFPRLNDRRHRAFARADERGRRSSERELAEMIDLLESVPSISLWVPFNEGWGQFDAARIAAQVARRDPSRPVDHASGWHDQRAGDLLSRHIYFRPFRLRRAWLRDPRVVALTEYGGYSLALPGHEWGPKRFGYRRFDTAEALRAAFTRLHREQIAPAVARGLSATVYTQLSDVEDEDNGLVSYDRRVEKIPAAAVAALNDELRAAFARGRTRR